jgi:hypothetical protein
MRSGLREIAIALLATSVGVAVANAQASYPCVNDAPNPYKQVNGWEQMPRHWAPTNNVYVDGKDNIWVMDRPGSDGPTEKRRRISGPAYSPSRTR